MKAETNWYDHLLADGELGTKQLRMLSGILNSLDKRPRHQKILLYLHHHPFLFPDDSMLKTAAELITHRLKDGQALMSIIKGRVDLLLFGHEHRHLNFSNSILSSQYDIPHIHSAGKCTEIADEYQIDHQGKATQRVLKSGMLANKITINKGKITVRTIAL